MAAAATNGRDKLTLLLPPAFAAFGLWVEQLVAESTGKQGAGVVPITGEPAGAPYGADRVFRGGHVRRRVGRTRPRSHARTPRARRACPSTCRTPRDLAAEFLRWEVATATAGLLLGVNPFDEPNVKQAKDATRALLDAYARDGRLPFPEPHATVDGARCHLQRMPRVSRAAPRRGPRSAACAAARLRRAARLRAAGRREPFGAALANARAAAGAGHRLSPRTSGYGPRYLHSTGQLHKGGPNTGRVRRDDRESPGRSAGARASRSRSACCETAQALGDFQSLDARRPAVHVHLPVAIRSCSNESSSGCWADAVDSGRPPGRPRHGRRR